MDRNLQLYSRMQRVLTLTDGKKRINHMYQQEINKMLFDNALILVTGGAGSIGGNLVEALIAQNADVIILDNLSSGYEDNIPKADKIQFIKGTIVDDAILNHVFSQPISYIFHLAALFANQNSIEHPLKDLEANAMGTLKLLEYSTRLKTLRRFVNISSSCVYGHTDGVISEGTPLNPDTPYAISKVASEQYVNFYYKYHELPVTTLRYFNVYGPGEHPGKYRNVIPNFFKWAMNGMPLPITGTGNETRTFTFVTDVIDATLRTALNEDVVGECFNISSDGEIQIIDLANKINSLTGNRAGVRYAERRKWDSVKRRSASYEKAKRILGYQPQVSIDDGLKQTYTWFLELKAEGKI